MKFIRYLPAEMPGRHRFTEGKGKETINFFFCPLFFCCIASIIAKSQMVMAVQFIQFRRKIMTHDFFFGNFQKLCNVGEELCQEPETLLM